jgi:hypothetical protein
MAAVLKEQFIPAAPDSVESVDAAINELTRLYVEADARRGQLGRRLREVQSGAVEVRRRHARNALDAFLPGITFYSIEYAEPEPGDPVGDALPVLFNSLEDVVRLWQEKYMSRTGSASR